MFKENKPPSAIRVGTWRLADRYQVVGYSNDALIVRIVYAQNKEEAIEKWRKQLPVPAHWQELVQA